MSDRKEEVQKLLKFSPEEIIGGGSSVFTPQLMRLLLESKALKSTSYHTV